MSNQKKLRDNLTQDRSSARGAPREGAALLSGLAICGRCGLQVRSSYSRSGGAYAYYGCASGRTIGQRSCWTVRAGPIDRAVERLFLETMVPDELDLSLAVEREVGGQAESLQKQWKLRLEQAEYEARRAERRYKAVDPDNRVVARTLEREWENCLVEVERVRRDYESARRERRVELSDEDRERVRALARDLPSVWRSSTTTQSDRKAMLRLVIEAVSLWPVDVPRRSTMVRVAWKSGAVSEIEVARLGRNATTVAVQRIRELAAMRLYDNEIANRLNAEGLRASFGKAWTPKAVAYTRKRDAIASVAPHPNGAPPMPEKREDGRYSVRGAATHFGVSIQAVRKWLARGLVHAVREAHPHYPHGLLWLDINDAVAARLKAFITLPRHRPRPERRSPARA